MGNAASSAVRCPCGAPALTKTLGAYCCLGYSHQNYGLRFLHYTSSIHHGGRGVRSPHTSCHVPVKYEIQAKLSAVAYKSGPGTQGNLSPLAPQIRPLRVPDQVRASLPSDDLGRAAAATSAHSVVTPAWLRSVPAPQWDADPT